jgi:integrase
MAGFEGEQRGRGGAADKALTDATIRGLKPGANVGDASEPGLRVLVRGSGARTFAYRYRDTDGRLRQVAVGAYGAGPGRMSLSEARGRVRELKRLRGEVGFVREHLAAEKREREAALKAQEQQAAGDANTVRVLAREYVEARAKLRSIRELDRSLRKYVLPKLADRPIAEVRAAEVFAALGPLAREHAPQARIALAALRSALSWAVGEGKLDSNPLIGARPPWGKANKRERWLKPAEIGRFLLTLPDVTALKPDEKDALHLQLLVGARVGEVVAAEWREVDLRARTWTIPSARSKNGREHVIHLSRQARDLLLALPSRSGAGKSPWLFPRTRAKGAPGHLRVDAATKAIKAALPELKLEAVTTHTLRHTVSTHLARLGFGREIRDRVTNHTPQGIDAVYQHHKFDEEALRAWQAWADELDRLKAAAKKAAEEGGSEIEEAEGA